MKKLVIKISIFLLVFVILAIGTTAILINKQKSNFLIQGENSTTQNDNNKNNQQVGKDEEKGIDLYGTYNENDLIINKVVEQHNGVEIEIPVIEGLKNVEVEEKVNKDIRNRIYEVLNNMSKVDYTHTIINANFGNIVSMSFYCRDEGAETSNRINLNYELVNGEELKFEDVFKENTDIYQIVRQGFYYSQSHQNWEYDWEDEEYDPVIYVDEALLYKLVNGFMKNEYKDFVISPNNIVFYYKDYFASVDFENIADEVVIYNKYLTNQSIFERHDIGRKNIFTCVDTTGYDNFDNIEYGYLADNLWYDITIENYRNYENIGEERYNKFIQFEAKIENDIREQLNEYIEKAKKNPDIFYIFLSKPQYSIYYETQRQIINGEYSWDYFYSDMMTINPYITIYEMPISLYEEKYKDEILSEYRYKYFIMRGGVYINIEEDEVKTTRFDKAELYNYMLGEKLTKLTDIFIEESAYMDVIKDKIVKALDEREYYSYDTIELLEKAEYELEGESVVVRVPIIPNFELNVYFREFDKSMFKLFDN